MKSSLLRAVRELSLGERESLLKSIRTQPISDESASLERSSDYLKTIQTPVDEIIEELEKDFQGEGFWRRFLLRVFSSFTGKSLLQAYRDYRVNQLMYMGVRGSLQPLLDISERKLRSIVFRKIYQIYRQAQNLMPFFSCSLIQEEGLVTIIFELLGDKILSPKETLTDFFDDEEILELFKSGQKTKTNTHEIVSAKVKAYLASIHPQVFKEIEARLESFMLTRFFVFLPYHSLMRPFVGEVLIESKSEEELIILAKGGASFDDMFYPLEKVSYYLNAYCHTALDFELFNKTFDLYYEEVAKNIEEFSNFTRETFKEVMTNKVLAFHNNIKLFQKTIPIPTFMKIFRQDPYYEVELTKPVVQLQVRDFYSKILETSLLAEWKESTKDIAQRHWAKEVQGFLGGDVFKVMDKPPYYFSEQLQVELKSWGEVVLLHYFLEKYGDAFFSYFLKTLMHVVLANKIIYRNEVEVQEATLAEFSKIERINYNSFFKECREFHKKLANLEVVKDKMDTVQRWLTTVEARNKKLLEEFYDYFKRLREIFISLQKAPELAGVLNISYTLNDKRLTIGEALRVCEQTIDTYFSLVEIHRLKSLPS